MRKYLLLLVSLLLVQIGWAKNFHIISSFTILGDVTKQIGGDRVSVSNIIKENQDAHGFEIKPQDIKVLKSAQLILVHGLDFESAAMMRMVKNSQIPYVVATTGIKALHYEEDHDEHEHSHAHSHEHHDPHIWHNPVLMKKYAQNIANALIQYDPQGKTYYQQNLKKYQTELDLLDQWAKQQFSTVAETQRKILTPHDAFSYLAEHYHIQIIAPLGLSEQGQASAKTVAAIIRKIKQDKIKAIFLENIQDDRLIKQIARETKLTPGKTLYSDALSTTSQPAATYLDMMRYNIKIIIEALKQ